MQKFVTIHVHSNAYVKGFFHGPEEAHGAVEEYLAKELAEGWCVVHIAAFGGMNEFAAHSGWFAVVLEKPDPEHRT